MREPISRLTAFRRTLRPLRVIADPALEGPFEREVFLESLVEVSQGVNSAPSLEKQVVGLWQVEKLGYSYCRNLGQCLQDPDIPVALQPILHVGLGVSASEKAQFSPATLIELIESSAHLNYRLFPYESAGCIWAVYANRLFKTVFRLVSRSKMPKFRLPPWRDFVTGFPPEIQPLLAHGYGRTLYFKNFHLGRALRETLTVDGLDVPAAVQGIAFAYLILNYDDLLQALDAGQDIRDPALLNAFRNGLVYGLTFLEWAFPGFLDSLEPISGRQGELITAAIQMAAEAQRMGRLETFGFTAN